MLRICVQEHQHAVLSQVSFPYGHVGCLHQGPFRCPGEKAGINRATHRRPDMKSLSGFLSDETPGQGGLQRQTSGWWLSKDFEYHLRCGRIEPAGDCFHMVKEIPKQ